MPCVQTPQHSSNEPLLAVKQLAAHLGCSLDWIYKRVRKGAPDPLPFIPLGGRIKFRLTEIEADLEYRRACRGTLAGTNGIARVKGKEKSLTRKRFQTGSVRLRTDCTAPWWEGFYREDVRLSDGSVVRKQRTANLGLEENVPTKRLAMRKLAEKLAPINDPSYRPGSEITLEQFMPKYEDLRLANKKGTTRHSYKVVFRKHIVPAFGKRLLSDISEEDVQRFINRKSLDVAWNTLKNIKWAFSAIFTAAIKYGYAKQNPVRATDLPPEPVVKQLELPTAEQLQQLMDALDEETQMMVRIDCLTALRPGELLALRHSAIDFARKCLWVREAVNHGDIHTPKYHRQSRPIRLADTDLERLRIFMAKRPDAPADDWLFPNEAGTKPKEYVNILRRKIQPKAKELGLPHVTWRLLRHWNSTVLQDSGVPVRVAMERLGHSRPETTLMHYSHVTISKADEAAQIVSTMFGNRAS